MRSSRAFFHVFHVMSHDLHSNHVSQGMVLLVYRENGCIRYLRVLFNCDPEEDTIRHIN